MSVINQVLLDLERRRASNAERGMLPHHVRVLPDRPEASRALWLAVLAAVTLAAGGWALWPAPSQRAQATMSPTDEAQGSYRPRVPQGRNIVSPPAHAAPEEPAEVKLAARLSFELSRMPDPVSEVAMPPPIPAQRLIEERADAAPVAPRETAPAAVRPAKASASRGHDDAVRAVEPKPAAVKQTASRAEIEKQVREPTARELAEADYRKGLAGLKGGQTEQARDAFEAALSRYPRHHGARQALLGVLVAARQYPEAERVMLEGVELAPHQIGFAMALARLQVERGDNQAAIATLRQSLPHASGNGDYHAFLAGLLQAQKLHAEAIERFSSALSIKPRTSVWLLGLGVSLQALGRDAEARAAFEHARAVDGLSPDLRAFADARLQQLQ